MKRAAFSFQVSAFSLALACVAIGAAGCTTPAGRGSRLLPWNWFHPDRVAQLEKAEAKGTLAEQAVVKSAQEDVRAARAANDYAPPSRPVEVAKLFLQHADAKLAQAAGPLTIGQDNQLRALVSDLVSENEQLRAAGAAELARRDSHEESLSRELEASRAEIAAITGKLKISDTKLQAQAEKWRKWTFYALAFVAGWILLHVLSAASKLYPSLAPVSKLAGHLTAPVLQAANNKLHNAVGAAIAGAEKVSSALADQMRELLDKPLDEDNKTQIRLAYEKAART